MTRQLRTGVSIILFACVVGGLVLWRLYAMPAPLNPGWKRYENKTYGLSFEYPPSFTVTEDAAHGYFSVSVVDPETHAGYLSVHVPDSRTQAERDLADYLTGPYPKTVPARGITSARDAAQRTLANGLEGIEFYGYGGEGHSYDDTFVYAGTNHLWLVNLDPVLEGRIATYPELGTPTPERDTYERILASLHIADVRGVVVVPLTDGTDVPWAGIYHAATAQDGLKAYASTTLGVSLTYPSAYLLFTRASAYEPVINLAPATSTLQAIARANVGNYGEAPGTIALLFELTSGGQTLASLPAWLGANTNVSNFDPQDDPAIKLASTTVAGFPALSYRTSLGLYAYDYRALLRDGKVILIISAADIPEQDFETVLSHLTLTP